MTTIYLVRPLRGKGLRPTERDPGEATMKGIFTRSREAAALRQIGSDFLDANRQARSPTGRRPLCPNWD
jgi:hypothetical protein